MAVQVRVGDVGRGRSRERTRRAVVAAAVCVTLVIAVAWLGAPGASAPSRASLSGVAVEFTVPAHATAGEVVDVDVPGAPAREVEIPPGAVPGQELSFTEASALQRRVRAAGPRTLAPAPKAAAGEEEVEFKVPVGSGPGALLGVEVPGGGVREVEVPAGAKPGEELSIVARTPSRSGGGGGTVNAGAGAVGAGASLAGARQAGHSGPASAGHVSSSSVRTHALAASSAGEAGHERTAGAGHVSAASVRTHALAAGASDAAAVASVAAAAAASGVGGGEQGGEGAEGEGAEAEGAGDGQAGPEAGEDSALADKIAAGFNPKTGKWRGTADDPFGWLKRQQYYEQEHVKQVAKWTQFIADQHAQGPDGYMTAIENAKAVWHKTHPGLRFGAPVPYRCVCVFVCVCLCACVCVRVRVRVRVRVCALCVACARAVRACSSDDCAIGYRHCVLAARHAFISKPRQHAVRDAQFTLFSPTPRLTPPFFYQGPVFPEGLGQARRKS